MKKTVLREYAKLIVRRGVNVQKGQEVVIYAGLDQPEFVAMVVEEAYKAKAKKVSVEWSYQPLEKLHYRYRREVVIYAGLDQPEFVAMVVEEAYKAKAKKVSVEWSYQPLEKLHYRYRSLKTLGTVEEWQKAKQEYFCEHLPCRIYLESDDPDGLKGINQEKMAKARQMQYPILKPYSDRRENKEQWCIAAVPGAAWAKKVFPGMRTSTAMEKLWEAILTTSRVDEDPMAAWNAHNADLQSRCDYLNSLHIQSLHYTAFPVLPGPRRSSPVCAPAPPWRSCGRPFSPRLGWTRIPWLPGMPTTPICRAGATTSTACTSRACTTPLTTAQT